MFKTLFCCAYSRRSLFSETLFIGRNFAFQNGLGLTIKTASTNSPWVYIREGLLYKGFVRVSFGGLIFGRAYYWNFFFIMGKRPNCLTLFFLLDSWCKLDLGFVVDTSKSIKVHNIDKVRIFLKRIVEKFQISENETHVSLETFDRVSILHNKFSDTDYHNESAIKDLFDRKVRQPLRKPTRLDLAIKTANEEMFIEANGDRPEVQSVMVLLTDGRSHPRKTEPFIDDV